MCVLCVRTRVFVQVPPQRWCLRLCFWWCHSESWETDLDTVVNELCGWTSFKNQSNPPLTLLDVVDRCHRLPLRYPLDCAKRVYVNEITGHWNCWTWKKNFPSWLKCLDVLTLRTHTADVTYGVTWPVYFTWKCFVLALCLPHSGVSQDETLDESYCSYASHYSEETPAKYFVEILELLHLFIKKQE